MTDPRKAARARNGTVLIAGTRLRAFLYLWHRRLGLAAAPLVVMLVVTGILLDWAHELGLDRAEADAAWLRAWYGLPPPAEAVAFRAGAAWVISLDDALYLGPRRVADDAGPLVGAAALDGMIVAASAQALFLLTPEGEMVERLGAALLPGPLDALGAGGGGQVVVVSGSAAYAADSSLARWADAPLPAAYVAPATPPAALLADIRARHGGPGVSWERVLLDLHSGRLLGRLGPTIVDAAALALGLLAFSGLYNAWRRS